VETWKNAVRWCEQNRLEAHATLAFRTVERSPGAIPRAIAVHLRLLQILQGRAITFKSAELDDEPFLVLFLNGHTRLWLRSLDQCEGDIVSRNCDGRRNDQCAQQQWAAHIEES
jgi:hypothetical protein